MSVKLRNSRQVAGMVGPMGLATVQKQFTPDDYIAKFGENADVDTAAAEDIWSQGGLYTFSTTADIVSVSSSDAGDTEQVEITGLDANWNIVKQTITLTGQTIVTLATPLIRAYRMKNVGSADLVGTVYCYVGTNQTAGVPNVATDIRATIVNGDNQTEVAISPVPDKKVGFLLEWSVFGTRPQASGEIVCTLRTRSFGGVFQVKRRISFNVAGGNPEAQKFVFPQVITGKSDVLVRCDEVSANNMGIGATFELLLVDETEFPRDYLIDIGQPGY